MQLLKDIRVPKLRNRGQFFADHEHLGQFIVVVEVELRVVKVLLLMENQFSDLQNVVQQNLALFVRLLSADHLVLNINFMLEHQLLLNV